MNTFLRARDCETKELIRRVGARYAEGLQVRRVLDVGSGAPADEAGFFHRCATHPDAVAMNCPAYSNIDLRAICDGRSALRPLQADRTTLPDGRPLRALASRDEARCFRSHSPTLEAWWGSFFVAFEKQG